MVDPGSNSLLLLYDDAQSLYSGEKRKGFSFSQAGIQARGRTTILRLNYRNTAEVLEVAYEFAREALTPKEAEEDGVPLLSPQSAGRHGPAPEMIRLSNWTEEGDYVAERLQGFRKEGMPWNHMAILYRKRFMGEDIAQGLERKGIPVEWLDRDKGDRRYRPRDESVKVMTMHSSKGLEFPVVVVPYAGYAPQMEAGADEAARRREEARLLYVAMTRAMDRLVLTHHTETVLSARLRQAVRRVPEASRRPA